MKFPCKWIQVPKYFVSYKKLIVLLRVMNIQKMSVGNVLVVNGQKKCRTKMRKSFDCDEKKKIQNKKFFRLKSVCFFRKKTTRINVDDENLVILAVFISNILSKNIVSNLLSKGSYLRCFYKLLNKKKKVFFFLLSHFSKVI